MVLRIAFSVDDIAPITGFGLNKKKGNLKYLIALNKEFGVKFTLFVIPNYKGKVEIVDYANWSKWLNEFPFFEIAAHGFTHWNNERNDSIEFHGINEATAEVLIKNSIRMFNEVGIKPKGFKFPGWLFQPKIIEILPKYFDYLADHFVSIHPIKMTNGFYRIPYTLSTENLHSDHYDDVLILHSHINVDKQNKNGFTDEHYHKIRKYLKDIIDKNKGDVKFVTLSELIK